MLIDKFSSNCVPELYQHSAALDSMHHLYLLIDGAFIPGLHRSVKIQKKRILFETLPSCNDDTRDASPFLVGFDRDDRSHRNLMMSCNGWPMLSVIETPETLDQLAARLAAWCIVDVGEQRFNLRFSDTRRLPAIVHVLTPIQTTSFMGPATRWDYVGRDGNWHALQINPRLDQWENEPTFSPQQFAALVSDSRADEILALLAYRGKKLRMQPSTKFNAVMAAINKVEKLELDDFEKTEEILSLVCA